MGTLSVIFFRPLRNGGGGELVVVSKIKMLKGGC